jgi:hypothetical protein
MTNVAHIQTRKIQMGEHVYSITYRTSKDSKGACKTCGGRTLRSWSTGILHTDCYRCRHLKMIYGDRYVRVL